MENFQEFAILRQDEDSNHRFWEIVSAANKDYTRLDDGENVILSPKHFKLGTVITIEEPENG
jgi:hypothetical protein